MRIETLEQRQQREREIAARRTVVEMLRHQVDSAAACVARLLKEIEALEQ